MKVLIDSHALIWSVAEPQRLSARARRVLTHPEYELMFSMVSLWELTIKIASGKLIPVGASVRDIIATLRKSGVEILPPIRIEHILRLEALPLHHRDPFDRLLIAQAMEDELTILTNDAQFRNYPAKLIW